MEDDRHAGAGSTLIRGTVRGFGFPSLPLDPALFEDGPMNNEALPGTGCCRALYGRMCSVNETAPDYVISCFLHAGFLHRRVGALSFPLG